MSSETLGSRIKGARQRLSLTQRELAARLGVSRSAVGQWETDKSSQQSGNLLRIADALGVTVEYLLIGNANPYDAESSNIMYHEDNNKTVHNNSQEDILKKSYFSCDLKSQDLLIKLAKKLSM